MLMSRSVKIVYPETLQEIMALITKFHLRDNNIPCKSCSLLNLLKNLSYPLVLVKPFMKWTFLGIFLLKSAEARLESEQSTVFSAS